MKSVVFDNAGTILRRVSVLVNMHDKSFSFETNTIGIAHENINKILVVIQTPTEKLIKKQGFIIDYLKENPDEFEISYSQKDFTKDDVLNSLSNNKTTINDIKLSALKIVEEYDIEICSGSALIIDMEKSSIDYVYTAGGMFFKDTKKVFQYLKNKDIHIYIASGDNRQSLNKIAKILDIPQQDVFDTSNRTAKEKIVKSLQQKGDFVYMVGNNTNDELAINQADVGILSLEQKEELPEYLKNSADYVIDSIGEVIKIVG